MEKILSLVVHNSDEVKGVFIGFTKDEILSKLKESKYWENIIGRLEEEFVPVSDEDDIEGREFKIDDIDLDTVTELHHDGDSEDGYTLIQTI
jgi:hypothetical protein